jgi:hypothetical protein
MGVGSLRDKATAGAIELSVSLMIELNTASVKTHDAKCTDTVNRI